MFDQFCDQLRLKCCDVHNEEKYLQWLQHFVLFHDKRHTYEMRMKVVEAFLARLGARWHGDDVAENRESPWLQQQGRRGIRAEDKVGVLCC